MAIVAARYHMTTEDLRSRNGTREYAEPRQIAAYLCRQITGATLAIIGRYLNQHHSTVIHSIEKVSLRCRNEPAFSAMVESITAELGELHAA